MSLQDYEIISKLGSGSFGVVHKARDKKTNNICVIKIVDISNMNAKLRKSAIDEGKILHQMNSPYIVKHFNTFIHKSALHIVMQYCPKGDLAAYMKSQMGKPIKQQTIWKLSIQMMVGLRDLHAKKILHRDIKTLNVFLDENHNVRIGDLGVAKTLNADFAHTIVGTPYYLSPQMCQEKPYNEKTDIWAMGCIIYELCAGKRPFEANNQAALALKIVMGKFDNIPSHYSSDLSWIVKSCLSLDYKRRPTAAYILAMPKTKEWATKLNIQTQTNTLPTSKSSKEQSFPATKQSFPTPQISKVNIKQEKQKQKPKQASKQKQADKIKLSKEGEINIKQVINNKAKNDAKQKKFSGAKRFQMKVKQQQKQQITKPKLQKKQGKILPKPKIQQEQRKPVDVKGYHSQMPKNSNQKKQKIMNTTMNKFLPQKYKQSKQFDYEDQNNMNMVEIPDSDSSDKDQIPKIDNKNENGNKKDLFHGAQRMVDEDDIAKQFGIPQVSKEPLKKQNQKQQNISRFHLDKKPLSINWNEIGNDSQVIKKNKSIKMQQIPTIKSPSSGEVQKLLQMQINEQQSEDLVDEQINENRPYISDQEDLDQTKQQEQLLIQDFDQKQQDLVQKMKQNEKRKNELQRMKNHLQPQLLKLMQRSEYEQLKLKLIECKQDEVEEFVASWKNNIKCINLFYRIIHFDMEIKRCQSNLSLIHSKIEQIKKQKA